VTPEYGLSGATTAIMSQTILLLNGPNLNLLGTREPHLYGKTTLEDVQQAAVEQAANHGFVLEHFQSNHEGHLIDRIQEARARVAFVIINPGALTHTSVGIRDALVGCDLPFVEVHITNIHAREAFRHHSYLSDKATAVICGLGVFGYKAAIDFVAQKLA
jgi:3-dehydroquinate dehydratase-2